jgi:hypothetical protein
VANGEPGPSATHQVSVDSYRIYKRDQGRIFDHTDPAPLKVVDLEAQQFGEEQHLLVLVRHDDKPEGCREACPD